MLKFTQASMTYNGAQISANNKVPAGQSFIIAAGVIEVEDSDVVAFIPLGSTGLITADGKRFLCRKDDADG